MLIHEKIADWLETHWIAPAYSGWLMIGLSTFFFAAATNTMAGWLYVISGGMFALLLVGAVSPGRSLRQLKITRSPINPVNAGDPLIVELMLANPTHQPKTLVQVQDMVPYVLGKPVLGKPAQQAIEVIPSQSTYHWVYNYPTEHRGIYRWHLIQVRTAAPLGLFWCRRSQTAPVTAIVYPRVLPLNQCPLVDEIGREVNPRIQNAYQTQGATEGVTRTLRPYRWGDSTRLIHWRTSARYGELRVRELETFTGGQEIVVCLDSAIAWNKDHFEQAVIATASIYFYGVQHHLQISLWTAGTGIVRGKQSVLETLAAIGAGEDPLIPNSPELPLVWITCTPDRLRELPQGSRWLLWQPASDARGMGLTEISHPGLVVRSDHPLELQLQMAINTVK